MGKKLIKFLIKNSIILHFTFYILHFTGISNAEVQPPRNPDSAKECAICHYNWIDTFFIHGKGSDLVKYVSEKVVAKPEICFSCHDGSVVDSRARVYNDHRHKVNKAPPLYMKIPKMFPLDAKGYMQCATCHTAHGVASDMSIETTIFLRTTNNNSEMCHMCHTDKDGGIEAGNHPIGISTKMEIPQATLISMGGKVGAQKNQIICETCHNVHGSVNESLLIETTKGSRLCTECHRDKEIFTPEGNRNPFHAINVKPKNVKIPPELIKKGAKLSLDGEIICLTCHKVHNNKIEQHLLLIKNDGKSTVCLTCHTDKQYLTDTKHNLTHSAPDEKNLDGKTAAEAGICSACHLPHKPARTLSKGIDFTTQLCLSCHSKGNIAEKTVPSDYTHPLNVRPYETKKETFLITMAAEKESLTLPLFNKYGVHDKNGEIRCTTCHDPHRWRADSAKGEIRKDVTGDKTTSFLRKPSPELCKACHSDKFYIANSKHDLNKVAPKEKNILNQTPKESGVCETCHLAHGGQKDFLWAREITTQSDNVVQNLCINCHNENGMAKKKVIKDYSHPINISPIEKGLTTTLPLYDKDGAVSKNGVITCQTCHDPHRWDPTKIVSGAHFDIEGNSQNSFLRLQNSPLSKLCENCHPDKKYIEKTDHDLLITAPSSKNILEQTPKESGICGVCHLTHNSKNRVKLWSRDSGHISSEENVMDALCNSCHSRKGIAEKKTPGIVTHPLGKLINNTSRSNKAAIDYAPLYDNSGKEVNVGDISCSTCHNAHQWDPLSKQIGTGKNLEGNAINSFLRNVSYNNICADCHGLDALFRYKYFHNPKLRVEFKKPASQH